MDKGKYYSIEELIKIWVKEKNIVGEVNFATDLIAVLQLLPKNILDTVMKGCLFFEIKGDQAAFYCDGRSIKGRSIIVIDSAKHKRVMEGSYTILHEIAHFILKHGSPGDKSYKETERKKDEQKADNLADNWQDEYIKAHRLGSRKPKRTTPRSLPVGKL